MEEFLKYYSRPEIQEAILQSSVDREVGVLFNNGGFGKRPDILQYPGDVLHLVKGNAIAFNISEERWSYPLKLLPGMKRGDLNDLRIGWDLVLDIDCDFIEYAKIAAHHIVKILNHYGCPTTIKFSGRSGFHIGVPFEAFPEKVKGISTKELFPEAPKIIAEYLAELLKPILEKELLKNSSIKELQEKTKIPREKLCPAGKFDPFAILHIDALLISSRHLFRAPYSINQKSGLVSIPIEHESILNFNLEQAKPDNVKVDNNLEFLNRNVKHNSAQTLFELAFDAEEYRKSKEDVKTKYEFIEKDFEIPKDAIKEENFPPCILSILKGLADGKKRAVFTLINFLTNAGWSHKQIEARLFNWNKKNHEPLRDRDILAQLNYAKAKNKTILPPNCGNLNYYKDLGVCTPDGFCKKIKNPTSYCLRKSNLISVSKNSSSKFVLTEEQKQKRRLHREKIKKNLPIKSNDQPPQSL